MGWTDLDEHVQVNRSFITGMPKVSVSLVQAAAHISLISLQILFWICRCLANSRKAKVNVLAVVSSGEIDWLGNVMCVGPVTAYIQRESRSCDTDRSSL